MSTQSRFEKEIESIEYDDSLTPDEKLNKIREFERDYRRMANEAAQNAYDEEYENWQ